MLPEGQSAALFSSKALCSCLAAVEWHVMFHTLLLLQATVQQRLTPVFKPSPLTYIGRRPKQPACRACCHSRHTKTALLLAVTVPQLMCQRAESRAVLN